MLSLFYGLSSRIGESRALTTSTVFIIDFLISIQKHRVSAGITGLQSISWLREKSRNNA